MKTLYQIEIKSTVATRTIILKKALSLLFVFIQFFCVSQKTYFDTLKADLETKKDAKSYLYKLLDSETENTKLAVICNTLGLQFQRESNLDSAFFFHHKALAFALKVDSNNQEIGISYNKIGIIYYYRGVLDSAIVFFEKSIPYYHDLSLKANSYNNLAIMNKYNSEPDVAIKHYLSAYDIYKSIKDTVNQIFVLNNIGALYNDLSSFDKAEEYLNKGKFLAEISDNLDGEISCKSNLGKMYTDREDFDKAVPLLQECIDYYAKTKEIQFLINNKNNLANCYHHIGLKNNSLKIYLEILELMEKTGIEHNKEAIFLNIGTTYQDLTDYDKALRYSNKALEFAKANNLVLRYETIYESLSAIYQSANQMDSSLFYKNMQIHIRDSLNNVEKEKKMMELEAQHQNKELNSDLKNKQSELDEKERQRALFSKGLMYSTAIILITTLGVFIFYNRYKKKKQLSEELTLQHLNNQANIQNLKSTLETKNEEIENLGQLKEKEKLPYPKNLSILTHREKEVLIGVQEGLKDQEIADKLYISITTVRTHLRKAYAKIDVRNRAEAIQFISKFEI